MLPTSQLEELGNRPGHEYYAASFFCHENVEIAATFLFRLQSALSAMHFSETCVPVPTSVLRISELRLRNNQSRLTDSPYIQACKKQCTDGSPIDFKWNIFSPCSSPFTEPTPLFPILQMALEHPVAAKVHQSLCFALNSLLPLSARRRRRSREGKGNSNK